MEGNEAIGYCLAKFETSGVDDAACRLQQDEQTELAFNRGKVSMLRTTFDTTLTMSAYIDFRKGSKVINKLDREALNSAIKETVELANASEPDEANAISDYQPAEVFETGPVSADREAMYGRLEEFLLDVKENHPEVNLDEGGITFHRKWTGYKNTNGVDFSSMTGSYGFEACFAAKRGEKVSSFNYTGVQTKELNKKLSDCGTIGSLLKQSVEQIDAEPFNGKFVGEVIITPDCMDSFLWPVLEHLGDRKHIAGNSLFKDKLNCQVACEALTFRSHVVDDNLPSKQFFTDDGFKSENLTIIENGVLKSNLLSHYGARKTGMERAGNYGSSFIIDSGDTTYEEMIGSVERGILLGRFSGGMPSANGDFSGVAKNSYYLENGKISRPVNEIMVTGNLMEMLSSIVEISTERVNNGSSIYPWLKVKGFTISGK